MVVGSGDRYLLLDVIPNNAALFDKLRDGIEWREMRQKGGRVPRDIAIQGTLTTEDHDQYEPVYRHPSDEPPELTSWTPTVLKSRGKSRNWLDRS